MVEFRPIDISLIEKSTRTEDRLIGTPDSIFTACVLLWEISFVNYLNSLDFSSLGDAAFKEF